MVGIGFLETICCLRPLPDPPKKRKSKKSKSKKKRESHHQSSKSKGKDKATVDNTDRVEYWVDSQTMITERANRDKQRYAEDEELEARLNNLPHAESSRRAGPSGW
ncbi:predicted protein [Chaetomium globosum CBS 148.51]|uniref:Uncharacterized protein n=1 Tax=Chaetomium globosum (strain ATCC 6205 / CBS 148.51 / DSM 1962 / NBRC 6347 / NRRL 1970) TaxID=306901 RepID=Q2GRX7_CHAGB|nr:uncharacterized protein CHGG_09277 [Chaetomium globosum CBS 148.51]EAQ85263.1 predicted protein [Chaetomium globosum CBS 148.51]